MSIIHKKVTPLVLAANRANSTKATGPKSALGKRRTSRNAGKYFVFGQVTAERMRQLGEDPTEFEKLHQSLRSEIDPRGGFEETLVQEMAVNRWRLTRLHRAEMAMLVTQRQTWEFRARNPEFAADEATDSLMMTQYGLAGVTDTPKKFFQILELLESLKNTVEKEGFTPGGLKTLEVLYGTLPTATGANLIRQFKAGLEESRLAHADQENSGSDRGEKSAEVETTEARRWFLTWLSREIRVCSTKFEAQTLRRTVPIPESTYEQLLILADEQSERIMRYEGMLQRDFERLQNQLVSWRSRRMEPPKR